MKSKRGVLSTSGIAGLGNVEGGRHGAVPLTLPVTYNKLFDFSAASPSGGPFGQVISAPTVYDDTLDLISGSPSTTSGISFDLEPTDHITGMVPTNVTFCIPLPLGVCTNAKQIRITDSLNNELHSTVEEVLRYRDFSSDIPRSAYIRSVLVRMQVTFIDNTTPINLKVFFDGQRTLEGNYTFTIDSTWELIASSTFFPSEYASGENIKEPIAVPSFGADWLCSCNMAGRYRPIDTADAYWDVIEGNDQQAGYTYPTNGGGTYAGDPIAEPTVIQFMKSLVNDVRPHVEAEDLITYEGSGNYAPWLYDRATTLWKTYFRTGDVKWFRHAHRATQFYQNHIGVTGYFDLRADDIKYSYGMSMLLDHLMTGDPGLLTTMETVTQPSNNANYEETYTYVEFTGGNSIPGWTERNACYAFLAQLTAYEATGTASYLTRAEEIWTALKTIQSTPQNGWAADGGLPHTIMAHEGGTGGGSGNDPVTSPWMSALLIDAVFYYYQMSNDNTVLTFLSNFGDYYANHSTYTGTSGDLTGLTLPWYLASSTFTYTDAGDFGDVEHAFDVMGAIAKCLWAKKQLGLSTTALQTTFTNLKTTLEWLIPYWIRTAQATIDAGQTFYRLAPPRKGSWWFNSTSDMTYLEEKVNG